eukprot:2437809-Pyramimonas_sp.AAC.1
MTAAADGRALHARPRSKAPEDRRPALNPLPAHEVERLRGRARDPVPWESYETAARRSSRETSDRARAEEHDRDRDRDRNKGVEGAPWRKQDTNDWDRARGRNWDQDRDSGRGTGWTPWRQPE